MRDQHIISILESDSLSRLTQGELAAVRAHAEECAACERAYRAARISEMLIRERAAVEVEPSPFFYTRVLAALRQRQLRDESSVLRRVWRATGALVSGMAATVVLLAALTFFSPSSEPAAQDVATSAFSLYPTEDLLARSDLPSDRLTSEQVLAVVYGTDEDAKG